MTLSFKTKINDKKTNFVYKILIGLYLNNIITKQNFNYYIYQYNFKINKTKTIISFNNKIHTIRKDSNNRWKKGNKIHFVLNNRTKNRFQFAPVIPVINTQDIWISPQNKSVKVWKKDTLNSSDKIKDGYWKELSTNEINQLSKNDGFDNINDFWSFFKEEFGGKIIHWTNFLY